MSLIKKVLGVEFSAEDFDQKEYGYFLLWLTH